MASLPTVGGDNNAWGTKLNDWLLVGHNADGSTILPTASYLYATGADSGSVASNAQVHQDLTATSSAGTDIAIDGVDAEYVNILTDGWYAIKYFFSMGPDSNDFTYVSAAIDLLIGGQIDVGFELDVPGMTEYIGVLSYPAVRLPTGEQLKPYMTAGTTGGATWQNIRTMQFQVVKLPIAY